MAERRDDVAMTYDEVVAAMFQPSPPGAVPTPTTSATPARRLRDAIEPLAMHPVWARRTNERGAELGLDFLGGYLWGRAAALGDAAPSVVVAAFAVFEPTMVTATYASARQAVPRQRWLDEREAATTESLGDVLADEDPGAIAELANRLWAVAVAADPTGRPLFAGLTDRARPASAVGRLWRACELLREHRGDSHNAVSVAAGLDPVTMNVLTESWVGLPLATYSATRGWSPERLAAAVAEQERLGRIADGALTEPGRDFRDGIEMLTDACEQPVVDALGATGVLDDDLDRLATWSARCVDAGAFPPDVYKRAAG